MSQSAALNAARQEKQSATAVAATDPEPHARCSRQHAPSVVKAPKFLLNLAVIGRCTVVIATEKSDQVDKQV